VSCARAKQEIAQVSLQNSAYVTLLSQRRVELRSDSKKSAAADSEDEESLPIAEGRRVSVASDSTFCIFQEWARTSFFRSELLDRSEKPTFTVYESTPQPELEWTLLPVVHPDGSILACVEGTLKALRFDSKPQSDGLESLIQDLPAIEWGMVDGKSVWSAAFNADGARAFFGLKDGIAC
jgi:hypothetical protein